MVLLGIDGRRNDGAILSKDKVARSAGTEPLDYGSTTGEGSSLPVKRFPF